MGDSEKPRPGVVIYRPTEAHCQMCELLLVVTRGTSGKRGNSRASAPSGLLMKRTRSGSAAGPAEVTSSFFPSMRLGAPLAPLL